MHSLIRVFATRTHMGQAHIKAVHVDGGSDNTLILPEISMHTCYQIDVRVVAHND